MDKKQWLVIGVICFLLLILFLIRFFSEVQLDDVNSQRFCEKDFIDKSDVLMIIPLLNNISIAENKTWCNELLVLNKTLAMHGVFHTSSEFNNLRDKDYVSLGMTEFEKCFGYSPTIFEAPELKLSPQNKNLLISMGFEIRGFSYELFHKVYHCADYDRASYLVNLNKVIRII